MANINLKEIKPNPKNPRAIKDEKFKKLCKSISDFPKMMELRPIVVDEHNIILGGNMRLRALQHLGYKEIPDNWVKKASELTDEQKQQFIIKDNVGFGEWDWEDLANNWDAEQLNEWGVDVPNWDEMKLPDEEQKEPDTFDGFIVVLKVTHETMPLVKEKIENICIEYGIQIDIS